MFKKLFSLISSKSSNSTKYFISSFESKTFSEPRECRIVDELTSVNRNDCLLIELVNPVQHPYENRRIEKIVIAGKYKPTNFGDSNQEVYILTIEDESKIVNGCIQEGSVKFVTEGVLSRSE